MPEQAISPISRVDREAARIGVSADTMQKLRETARQCPLLHNALHAVDHGMMPLAEALAQAALAGSANTRTLTDQVVQLRILMPSPGIVPR